MSDEVSEPPKLRATSRDRGLGGKLAKNIYRNPAMTKLRGDGRVQPFPRERFLEFCGALKIQSKDIGLTPFEMLGSQIYILDEICAGLGQGVTTFVILKSRNLGASTFFLALDMFWAFEHAGMLGVFVTHEEAARDQFRNQIDLFLETLPRGYKVAQNKNNAKMLVLKNASLFRYLVAGQRSQSNKLGRSGGVNFAHCTEVAFWGSADDLSSLNQTFSELYPHRCYFFESTANGFNHFESMWQVALTSPAQRAVFVGWWRDERNEFAETHPLYQLYMPDGVNTDLNDREREGVREVWQRYQFRITAGQIAWYRYHLETKCGGDQQRYRRHLAVRVGPGDGAEGGQGHAAAAAALFSAGDAGGGRRLSGGDRHVRRCPDRRSAGRGRVAGIGRTARRRSALEPHALARRAAAVGHCASAAAGARLPLP